jgi:anti-anti-sigma factor
MVKITEKKITEKKIVLVEVEGALSGSGSAHLEEYLLDLINRGGVKIILNAEKVSEFGSAGIGLLLCVTERAQSAGGIFVVFGLNYESALLIERLKADKIVNRAKDRSEALKLAELSLDNRGKYAEPLIIKCRECSSLVRVKAPGEYLCPRCHARFKSDENMKALFYY